MLIKAVDVIPENAVKIAQTICLLLNEFKKKFSLFSCEQSYCTD